MLKIINNEIYHRRGDTGQIGFAPTLNGSEVPSYTAIFSVKKTIDDTTYLYQKTFSDGLISITHEDTNLREYGDYWYDIEVRIDEGYYTVGPYRYHLVPDVTI